MICKICNREFEQEQMYGIGKLYCEKCYEHKRDFINSRKYKLGLLKALPLDLKIIKSKMLVQETLDKYGPDVYVSYSGGKDSTVLSHLVRQLRPDILHIFSNTTCEYPETLQHIKWEKDCNGMNIIMVKPYDKYKKAFNFKSSFA